MRITLGIDFDHGSWPGPLGSRRATAGEAWVGPAGLLSILETTLGLGGARQSSALRAAGLVPALTSIEGFWSRSAEHSPLATARALLGWRDRLWMQGWRGEGLTERLAALARVTEGADDGLPDRLGAVLRAAGPQLGQIEALSLCESRSIWSPQWCAVFDALERSGTSISDRELGTPSGDGDLAAARAALRNPKDGPPASITGDGSLQLVRPYGPGQAAEEVAAWIASLPSHDGVVIVGGDPILDRALRRHGLPTTGAQGGRHEGALLQILPLVLALGWDPPDPQRALELLTLPVSPVRWEVRKGLADALAEWPAVGSEVWERELDEGLDAIADDAARQATAERLAVLLQPTVPRSQRYPAAEVVRRTEVVQRWLAARRGTDADGVTPWDGALAQCRGLLSLVDAAGLETLSAPQMERFVDQASFGVADPAPYPAEAGINRIALPGGVVGAVPHLVWWGFDLAGAQRVPTWPFSPATRSALEAAGVPVPDTGSEALGLAERWQRPLLCATDSALLVCPQTGSAGDALYPHPLWDEICGHLGEAATGQLERSRPLFADQPVRLEIPNRPLPQPRRDWVADAERLGPREIESLSGLGDFLGCSLRWALKYHAQLWPGRSNQTSGEAALLGSLLHEIVERTLLEQPDTPEEAGQRALELFDELGPKLAAPFYLPGADAVRGQARRLAPAATRRLAEILARDGRRVIGAETWLTGEGLGGTIGGRLDLVVGDPPGIIDLKLGSGGYRRKDLRAGVSGLAIYSYLLREEGAPYPPYGYFIFYDQMLLSTDTDYFSAADPVDGPGPEETFRAWESAATAQRRQLDDGRLAAPGNPDSDGRIHPDENAVVEGRVVLEPPCHWCDFKVLCGRFFGEASR